MSIPALSGKNNRQAGKGGHRERFPVCSGQVSADREVHDEKADFSDLSSRGGAGSGCFLCALAQSGAAEAYALFSDFQEKGSDSGVAAFHAFQQAYTSLTDGTDKAANRPLCSAVYGSLLITPERAREHLPEILDTMRLLAADVTDENAFVHLAELSSALEE